MQGRRRRPGSPGLHLARYAVSQVPVPENAPVSSTARAARSTTKRRMRLSLASKQAAFGVMIILPTLAILTIFRLLPMVQAFYLSLTQYDLVHPPKFVGLANFVSLLEDPLFLKSARVSLSLIHI